MNIVADDCCLSCSIFFRGKGGGGGGEDLAEPDQLVLPTSSRVLAICTTSISIKSQASLSL